MDFSGLNCQLKQKKNWHTFFVAIFQVSADGGKNFFNFMLVWLAREKQKILTSQPYLHTLMQTLLSANQSTRTILVIL